MTKVGTRRQLDLILEGTDADLVVGRLKAILDAVPPDDSSAKDAHLRDMLEAFIMGYEIGQKV
jgi:hypothetical protein